MKTSTAFNNAVTENQVIITTSNSAMHVADLITTATTYATLSAIATLNTSNVENLELAAIIGGTTAAIVLTGIIICNIVCFATCFLLLKHKGMSYEWQNLIL